MSSNIRIKKTCQECGNEFVARTTVTKNCSDRCAKVAYKRRKRKLKIEEAKKEELKVTPQYIKNPDLRNRELFSVYQASVFIGVSKSTIYRLFDDGRLKKIKVRNRVFIRRSDINQVFSL